jgi:hypothetical protein
MRFDRLSFLAAAFLLGAGPASAFVMTSEYAANVAISRIKSISGGGTLVGGMNIKGVGGIIGPAAQTIPVTLEMGVSARAVVGMVSKVAAPLAAASVAYELWRWYRCEQGSGGTMCDPGVPKVDGYVYRCSSVDFSLFGTSDEVSFTSSSPSSACEGVFALIPNPSTIVFTFNCGPNGQNSFALDTFRLGKQTVSSDAAGYFDLERTRTFGGCHPLAGQSDESLFSRKFSYSRLAGKACQYSSPIEFFDGLCYSREDGAFVETQTPEEMQKLYDDTKNNPSFPEIDWPGLLEEIYPKLLPEVEIPAPDTPHKLTEPLPAEIPGPETTTTHPDGSTTKEETKWQVVPGTSGLTSPGRSNWEKTTTTTETDSEGNTQTSTETETPGGAPATPKDSERQEEPVDPCEGHEDRIMCSIFGDVEDKDLEQKEVNLSVTPMPGWGGVGACPAPKSVAVLGRSYTLDNTALCDFLSGVRPVVIAMAFVAAALIVLGGFKE